MIYHVKHKTKYDYVNDVEISHNLVHLRARNTSFQTCLHYEIKTSVPHAVMMEQVDFFGNPVGFFAIQEPHRGLMVESVNSVRVDAPPAPDVEASVAWEEVREVLHAQHDPATLDAYQFCFDSPLIKGIGWLADYAKESFTPGRPILAGSLELTRRIFSDFKYDPSATSNATSIAEVFKIRRGVCQDFAHLQIGCLRSLGLAARYVSGYLQTLPPPGQPRMIGADASHAWLAVYCPKFGWVDFDPTNNQIPSDKHVTLGWGRDYDDVSPIKGVILGGGRHTLSVSVDVAAESDDCWDPH